jgi:hypothetical protein
MPEIYVAHPDYGFDRDFKGYGEKGLKVQWPNKAKIAVSFVINYEEVCPYATSIAPTPP